VVTASFETGPAVYPSAQPIDILFVIDDTPAMAGVQASLMAQYSVFAQVFQALAFGSPPMHVAFIPATVPSSDCSPPDIRSAPCGLVPPDQFLSAEFCDVDQNSPGSLGDAFACLGNFGAQGCGTPQPLEAARRALGGALTGRSSFLHPGARLQIVFVSAEDDASTRDGALVPVSDYVQFFKSLTADPPNDVLVSFIGPEGCPSGASVTATSTPRLDQVTNAFGDGGVAVSVCDPFLAAAFSAAAAQIGILILVPCIEGIKDTDLTQPGLQPDCTIEAKITGADGSETLTSLAVCDPETPLPPCLSFSANQVFHSCSAGGYPPSVLLATDPNAGCGPSAVYAVQVQVACRTCADPADPSCAGP
jgi:hypothetical protein